MNLKRKNQTAYPHLDVIHPPHQMWKLLLLSMWKANLGTENQSEVVRMSKALHASKLSILNEKIMAVLSL